MRRSQWPLWLRLAVCEGGRSQRCPHFRVDFLFGAEGGIRTPEAVKQEIYSLSPLTAWVPRRRGLYFNILRL